MIKSTMGFLKLRTEGPPPPESNRVNVEVNKYIKFCIISTDIYANIKTKLAMGIFIIIIIINIKQMISNVNTKYVHV